ncbi:MAG: GatB/YqeY domain-containing protein [candidate division Zixibacteria bacterium]|nr:GatB/YqeY domain-containing protein [candidate division Zixibacteria bacterium]
MSTEDQSIHGESIKDKITQDMKKALAAKDKVKLSVIRLLKSEIRYKEIEKGSELSDDEIISVLSSSVKRHKDSIEQFEKGGRDDLAAQEKAELEIIWEYMPKQLEEDELSKIVDEAIKETDVLSPSGLGKVMKIVMPKVKGRADGKRVNELALSKLKSMSE